MNKARIISITIVVLMLAAQLSPTFKNELSSNFFLGDSIALGAQTGPLIIDHNTVDITAIPPEWIEQAKSSLNIYYGHTSHGSQLVQGMKGLVNFANKGGLGLALPTDFFAGLPLVETDPDAGYYPDWINKTRNFLGDPDPSTGLGTTHPETNVVLWSWCGQLSWMSEQEVTNNYLLPMVELEIDYPGITFVYMTGHSDGSGDDPSTSNLHARNQQVRNFVIENNKVLYDFYDIELYDPGGAYYGDRAVNDQCEYDPNGSGYRDANWCTDWQNSHKEDSDWYTVDDCAHSHPLNCNQKAYAAWWLWASIAGWDTKAAQPDLQPTTGSSDSVEVPQTPTVEQDSDQDEILPTAVLSAAVPPAGSIDDFDSSSPAGTEGWQAYWDQTTPSHFNCYLEDNSLRIDYDIADESWATCTLSFDRLQDWSTYQGIAFNYQIDDPDHTYDIIVHSGTLVEPTSYQFTQESIHSNDIAWIPVELVWGQILGVAWEDNANNPIDPTGIVGVSFGFSTNGAVPKNGVLWIQELRLITDHPETELDDTGAPAEREAPGGEDHSGENSSQTDSNAETPSDSAGGFCPGSISLSALLLAGVFIFQRKKTRSIQ